MAREASAVVCGSAGSGKTSVAHEVVRAPRAAGPGGAGGPAGRRGLGVLREHGKTAGWLTAELFESNLLQGECKLPQAEVHLDVWDIAGMDRVSDELATSYIRSAQIVFIVFDVTSRASFEEVYYWHEFVRRTGPVHQVCCVLAHKIDLTRRRVISLDEARNAAARLGVRLLETTCQGMGPDLLRAAMYEILEDLAQRDVLSPRRTLFSLPSPPQISGGPARASIEAAAPGDASDADSVLHGVPAADEARAPEGSEAGPLASFWDLVTARASFGAIEPPEPRETFSTRLWKWFDAQARAASQQLEQDRRQILAWMRRLGVPGVPADAVSVSTLLQVLSSGWAELQALEMAASAHALGFDRVSQLKRRASLQPRELRDNELRCPLGCGEILIDRASNIHEHVSEQCRLRQVACPLGCEEKIRFEEASDHVKGTCAKRFVECPVCTELVEQGALTPHTERWHLFPRQLWTKADLVHWAAAKVSAGAAQAILESATSLDPPHVDAERLAALLGCTSDDVTAALPVSPAPRAPLGRQESEGALFAHGGGGNVTVNGASSPAIESKDSEADDTDSGNDQHAGDDGYARYQSQTLSPAVVEVGAAKQRLLQAQLESLAAASPSSEAKEAPESPVPPVRGGTANEEAEQEPGAEAADLLAGIENFDRDLLRPRARAAPRAVTSDAGHMPGHDTPGTAAGTSPRTGNPMMASIANFDRSKLRSPQLHAAGPETPSPAAGNPLVAGIANFDRSKLRSRAAELEEPASPPPASGNPLVASIASFDRSKLRHAVMPDRSSASPAKSASLSPNNPSSNPLYSALAQAIERRREAIEGRD